MLDPVPVLDPEPVFELEPPPEVSFSLTVIVQVLFMLSVFSVS